MGGKRDNVKNKYSKAMKEKIIQIAKWLEKGEINDNAAKTALLNLFGVVINGAESEVEVCEHKNTEKVGSYKDIWCNDCDTMIKSGM